MEIMHLLSKIPMEACKWIYSCKEFSVDFECLWMKTFV